MLEWVELGESAFGLVLSGRIVALVYWHEADVVESDGRSVMTQAGLSWAPTDGPWEHFYLFATPDPGEDDWVHARALAARAYFEWSDARWTRDHDEPSPDDETAALRREAAAFLSRSPWWRDALPGELHAPPSRRPR